MIEILGALLVLCILAPIAVGVWAIVKAILALLWIHRPRRALEIERQESILRGLREPTWRMEIRHVPADDAALRQAIEARTAFRRTDRGEA